ncbi:hypothetical protein B296_00004701 [Ensete ventricosum]|uniref:Uncharacterized protein n=1 Tax=Ensete ventricosum TaxID=4639 RepID=A0A426XE23_ENSVE|nr:hypothetical protein B296_00004701 [Ensete ventricosum]
MRRFCGCRPSMGWPRASVAPCGLAAASPLLAALAVADYHYRGPGHGQPPLQRPDHSWPPPFLAAFSVKV